jgi:hypothetical protein
MILEYPGVTGSGEIWLAVMRAICGDTAGKSMIDLGCYHAPHTPLLGFKDRTYVDIQDRPLDFPEEQKCFVQYDMIDYLERCNKHFDISIASDSIEHLRVSHALSLLNKMHKASDKQILFTPLGEWMISEDDHPDSHKSGWTPDKLDALMPDHWAYIIFPDFHPTMNAGAFFFWHCDNIKEDFERVKSELNNKSWAYVLGG